MPLVDDQGAVGEFAADGADEPFGDRGAYGENEYPNLVRQVASVHDSLT
jgi:hypothetical protein